MARPQHGQRIFYDELVEDFAKEQVEWDLERMLRDPAPDRLTLGEKQFETVVQSLISRRIMLGLLREQAHIFWIDAATSHSLQNVPHQNREYRRVMNLPFPFMFFEFEEPLATKLFNGRDVNVGGECYTIELEIRPLAAEA